MKTRVLTTRLFTCCLMAIGCVTGAFAQSFTAERIDASPMLLLPDAFIAEHHGKLTNTSSTPKSVRVRYFSGGKSINHTANMCVDLCYELKDDLFGSPVDLPVFTLAAGAHVELKAQLIPEGYEGNSTLRFVIFDEENPSDSVPYSVAFNVNAANSVRDLSEVADVSVGPNPASERVTISSSVLAGVKTLHLFSADGRFIGSQDHDGSNVAVVDVASLPSGAYQITLTSTAGAAYRTAISVVR